LEACLDKHFENAAKLVGLDEDLRGILSRSVNEITVNFPVKTDDGGVEMFRGFRVQHNNARGP
jgi:glutamate dehydrogenase/leucine dehydrogenase